MVRSFTHDGPGTPASEWAERPEWEHVPSAHLDGFDHVLVVAAHPDDETLGAGGLIATAAVADLDVHLFVCTAGEHSHPKSTTHRPEELAARRENEVRAALGELAPGGAGITLLNVQDGHLHEAEQTLVQLLVRLIKDGRRTLIVAPWRHDGHPDHDAAGRAAATTARRTGATLWEYPIWWWHWARPGDAPWDDLRQLDLTDIATRRRRRALDHHRSQTEPLSDAPGDEALLRPHFVQHFTGPRERFILQETRDDTLDRLHRAEPDPWGVDERHYERRKRALSLAMLPRDRFARGLEIGCSVGALTADLAHHCDVLVAVDSSSAAVESARQRLSGDSSSSHVEVRLAEVPADWPEGLFDLVVVSEIGYFLSPRDLDDLVERIRGSLTPDGVLLLCHWRHPVVGWVLDGGRVHTAVERAHLRPVQARYTERDFEALVLCADTAWPDVDA
jgi:LmbE family N-acetylglucosaminyl deacetylase